VRRSAGMPGHAIGARAKAQHQEFIQLWRTATMSLYYEAAAILANTEKTGGSLKSRLFTKKDLKSSPGQIFALIAETSKWSLVLKDVIEKCGLLAEERKVRRRAGDSRGMDWRVFCIFVGNANFLTWSQLTPILALLLTHDLLVAKSGVAAPANHVLKLAITRHKARIGAEFTKARIRRGHATLATFKEAVSNGELETDDDLTQKTIRHPRWVRVNTIKSTLEDQLKTTFAGFEKTEDLAKVLAARGTSKIYYEDPNIPNLIAVPSQMSLGRTQAYTDGNIIFQDKASCFPAYLLDLSADDGDIIDGCAAPGNKTTHLAAITAAHQDQSTKQKVIAFERDEKRTITLQKMVKLASANQIVSIKGASDFLAAKPHSDEFANVGAIVLDPSCSGTGIVGRDDGIRLHLPVAFAGAPNSQQAEKGKKRKRGKEASKVIEPAVLDVDLEESTPEETPYEGKLVERLDTLSNFQLHILTHAMRFASVHKITYSTCSIHFEENEGVVFQALGSSIARQRGWKILKREHQVDGLKVWNRRGVWEDDKLSRDVDEEHKQEVLDACIRCDKATDEGTMGFFVAAFVREDEAQLEEPAVSADAGVEEWNGFSDADGVEEVQVTETSAKKKNKKKKRKTAAK
jgi:putative methyltransferase